MVGRGVPRWPAVPFRRSLVVTLADAQPGPATLMASRLLPWAASVGLRPVLVLGDLGPWRDRLDGHGPVISADQPDAYAAARFVRWTRSPTGLRPLRWARLRWWRLRLRRAGIVALSWPIPDIAARALPPRLRDRAQQPALPAVLPPVPTSRGALVAGVGPLEGWAGADLWLRAVHELHRRRRVGPFRWVGVGWDDDSKPFDHDRTHLGLDDVVERRGPDAADGTACEVLDADLLLLAVRPGEEGVSRLARELPGLELAVLPGAPPVVGFVGVDGGAADSADGRIVDYPDVGAAADEVEAVLARGPMPVDHLLEQLLEEAWSR
ncbi:hypothetical protein B7486_53345 [cyanobacterium TDX16]|nr:hypothetical protein B7486_53345 [cyanobacterium TDX16]